MSDKTEMIADLLTQGLQRRDRLLVVVLLLSVIASCWAWLLAGAGTMQEMDGMLMPMSAGPWTAEHAAVMLAMWAAMMTAMMLPSAMPMILLYAAIARGNRNKGRDKGGHPASTAFFVLGYVAVWMAFSVAAVALQFGLERAALLSPMMETTSIGLAGTVLIAAGIYQWTPWKHACLRHCRSPLDFVLGHWRQGMRGAVEMGIRHGAYCLGCCWMLMLLLFVGGIMNLGWIAGLALFVLVEKLAPAGHWLSRVAGILLIAWGAATLASLFK